MCPCCCSDCRHQAAGEATAQSEGTPYPKPPHPQLADCRGSDSLKKLQTPCMLSRVACSGADVPGNSSSSHCRALAAGKLAIFWQGVERGLPVWFRAEKQRPLMHRRCNRAYGHGVSVHLHRSACAFSWERHAPAWLLEPGWSPALPGKALAQEVLRKCTRNYPYNSTADV